MSNRSWLNCSDGFQTEKERACDVGSAGVSDATFSHVGIIGIFRDMISSKTQHGKKSFRSFGQANKQNRHHATPYPLPPRLRLFLPATPPTSYLAHYSSKTVFQCHPRLYLDCDETAKEGHRLRSELFIAVLALDKRKTKHHHGQISSTGGKTIRPRTRVHQSAAPTTLDCERMFGGLFGDADNFGKATAANTRAELHVQVSDILTVFPATQEVQANTSPSRWTGANCASARKTILTQDKYSSSNYID